MKTKDGEENLPNTEDSAARGPRSAFTPWPASSQRHRKALVTTGSDEAPADATPDARWSAEPHTGRGPGPSTGLNAGHTLTTREDLPPSTPCRR